MTHFRKVILILFCVFSAVSYAGAQGISFFQGTFQEALNKAKSENKPLFIDMYTVWCGPCKKMVKEIFPLTEVGNKFNSEFVNYKIDAEKGEGIEVAKKYKVNSYPTYLFLNGDGVLIYRSVGSMPSEKFMNEASIALIEFKDPKPFAAWQDEYEVSKNDKIFLWNYIQKRIKLKLTCSDLLDQYFSACTREEILESELIPNLLQFQNMNADGPFYTFCFQNIEEIKKVLKEKYKKTVYLDEFLVYVAKIDVDRAIAKNDEILLNKIVVILLNSKPDENPVEWREGEVRMKYYTQTKNPKSLLKVLDVYAKSVINFDTKKILQQDSLALVKFDQDLADGKIKNTNPNTLELLRNSKATSSATSYAFRIRDMARSVFNTIDDKKELNKALQWTELAVKYSNTFSILEVKAGLLYKLGHKQEAIDTQKKAIAMYAEIGTKLNTPVSAKTQSRLEEALQKMVDGKQTWLMVNN